MTLKPEDFDKLMSQKKLSALNKISEKITKSIIDDIEKSLKTSRKKIMKDILTRIIKEKK